MNRLFEANKKLSDYQMKGNEIQMTPEISSYLKKYLGTDNPKDLIVIPDWSEWSDGWKGLLIKRLHYDFSSMSGFSKFIALDGERGYHLDVQREKKSKKQFVHIYVSHYLAKSGLINSETPESIFVISKNDFESVTGFDENFKKSLSSLPKQYQPDLFISDGKIKPDLAKVYKKYLKTDDAKKICRVFVSKQNKLFSNLSSQLNKYGRLISNVNVNETNSIENEDEALHYTAYITWNHVNIVVSSYEYTATVLPNNDTRFIIAVKKEDWVDLYNMEMS